MFATVSAGPPFDRLKGGEQRRTATGVFRSREWGQLTRLLGGAVQMHGADFEFESCTFGNAYRRPAGFILR